MRFPPIGWTPEQRCGAIHNGQPTRALHALDIDRQSTRLAVRKWMQPQIIANYLDSVSDPWAFTVLLPAFTPHVEIWYLASGRGNVTAVCTDDAFDAVTQIYAGTGGAGSHSLTDAIETKTGEPLVGHAANSLDRALDVTYSRAPREVRLTLTVADYSGSQTLRIYGVRTRGWWPAETTLLTSAV